MFSFIKNKIKSAIGGNTVYEELEILKKAQAHTQKSIDEVYWSSVFNSSIADSKWIINKSFNPGRWAAGYPMLYILFRVYNDIKPKNILEFGLGESSKLTYQYSKAFTDSKFTIIEQDINWLNFFSNKIYDISLNTIVLEQGKREIEGHEVLCYNGLLENLGKQKFDFIIVDGPWGSPHYSRYEVVDLIMNDMIAEDFVIIIDDHERKGEQETEWKVKELLNKKGIKYAEAEYSGVKQTLLLCSEKYSFLTNL
jgi:hypothetical protein